MDIDPEIRAVSARVLPGDIQLTKTDDGAGWQVLRTRSTGEPRV